MEIRSHLLHGTMYGPLLVGLLTGDERQAPSEEKYMKRATVYGYSRRSLDADFPPLLDASLKKTTEGSECH
jgi:hypothetical protein